MVIIVCMYICDSPNDSIEHVQGNKRIPDCGFYDEWFFSASLFIYQQHKNNNQCPNRSSVSCFSFVQYYIIQQMFGIRQVYVYHEITKIGCVLCIWNSEMYDLLNIRNVGNLRYSVSCIYFRVDYLLYNLYSYIHKPI